MGFRYRKSIRLGKGVRININKNSVGISAGVKGARVSLNSKGRTTTTVGIPGTGISYVHTDSVYSKGKRSSQAPSSSDFGSGLSPKKPPKKRKWLGGFIMAMSVYWIITALVMSFRDNTLGLIEYLAYLFTAFLGVPAFSYGLRIFKGQQKPKRVRSKAEPAKSTYEESFFAPADDRPILDMPNQFVYQDPDEIDMKMAEEVESKYSSGPAPVHSVSLDKKIEPAPGSGFVPVYNVGLNIDFDYRHKQIKESLDLIKTTTNPDTFFSRLIYADEMLSMEASRTTSRRFDKLKDTFILAFIYRYYSSTIQAYNNLQQNKAKQRRIEGFEKTIADYTDVLSQSNLEYFNQCLDSLKSIDDDSRDVFYVPHPVIKTDLGIPRTYVSVDLETTGLSPINDKIIEIGGVKVVDDKVVAVFSELINPGCDIPPIITKITGLTSADLVDKPTIDIVLPAFIDFVGSDAIVGHNIKSFDMKFLDNARNQVDGKAFKNKVFDTLHLSRKVVKDSDNHKLQTLLAFFGIKVEKAHRAVDDSYAVVELIRKLEQYS